MPYKLSCIRRNKRNDNQINEHLYFLPCSRVCKHNNLPLHFFLYPRNQIIAVFGSNVYTFDVWHLWNLFIIKDLEKDILTISPAT